MIEKLNLKKTSIQFILKRKIPLIMFSVFLIFLTIYYLISTRLMGEGFTGHQIALFASFTLVFINLYYFVAKYIIKQFRVDIELLKNEYRFINLFTENTSEIIVLLNRFGKISNFNSLFVEKIRFEDKNIKGLPFIDIFIRRHGENKTYDYQAIIESKIEEVYSGQEVEIIAPVSSHSGEINNARFRLTPLKKNGVLNSILCTGQILRSDFITRNWLRGEKTDYLLGNEIKGIHLLTHRLTRNLEGRIAPENIIFIQIALHEVLINAIEHGNLEISYSRKTTLKKQSGNYWQLIMENSDPEFIKNRKVHVHCELALDSIKYQIRDEGPGFNWKNGTDSDPETIMKHLHGIGLGMVRHSFDSVHFNEKGNEITLIKFFSSGGGDSKW